MKRSIFVEIIKDFEERKLPQLVERELSFKRPTVRKALVFIGPRRAGKTYYCFNIILDLEKHGVTRDRILYVNLEDDRLRTMDLGDLDELLRTYYEIHPGNVNREIHLFLDEVQNVDGWERFVRRVMDSGNVQVYITGSSSRLLSKEIATAMRGRSLSYLILPFSFREYLKAYDLISEKYLSSSKKARILSLLSEYLKKGGFPEVVLEPEGEIQQRIMKDYVEVMLFRDVVERFGVKNVYALKTLFSAFLSATSSTFSINKFYNTLKSQGRQVGKNTLYDYSSHLEDVFAIHHLRAFNFSIKKIEQSLPKPYPIDPGLLTQQGVRFSDNLGIAMENIVAVELLRQSHEKPGMEVYYWRGAQQQEVDFVIMMETNIVSLMQVCYDTGDRETRDREMRALKKAGKDLCCTKSIILTWDEEETVQMDNMDIQFIPLWKWLLDVVHLK